MSISIWRYSHLALAVSSFLFIFLASVTGIILAFEPISEQLKPYKVSEFEEVLLAETIGVLQQEYDEVLDVQIDANGFVLLDAISKDGEVVNGYINPTTGVYLGDKIERLKFFQFTTNLHRSLFLKSIGRFFVGLCSFLLFLIAISGTILIVKRQRSFKKFFSKIVNENFSQYWHVVLGRLSLLPIIIIITITGVYLSLEKFNMLPEYHNEHIIDFESISESPKQEAKNFSFFKNTKLSQVKVVEFPFSSDVEDYFLIKLKHKEVTINQYTGAVLSEVQYPLVTFFSTLSLSLHTGKGSIIWSVILAIACINILFFIYSGFAMTFKRRASKLKNKYKKDSCKYVILVGSENGGTLPFANALYNSLIKAGETCFITELNNYTSFKKAEQLIIITSTYGEGEAPTNANKFLKLVKTVKSNQKLSFAVVGFGSYAYPDFCKFAFAVDKALSHEHIQLLQPFTINDKSVEGFRQWVALWNKKTELQLAIPKDKLAAKPKPNSTFLVTSKTQVNKNPDNTFLIQLKPKKTKAFSSGDLLAIYPKNDYRERLYSIGKVKNKVHLTVKLHEFGLGSNYLNELEKHKEFKARIIKNSAFHFPKKASRVILIANGTGIAPFLGMLHQNTKRIESHLYYGVRQEKSFGLYKNSIKEYSNKGHLKKMHLAFSQQGEKKYVQDLIKRDATFFAETLKNKGVIMICGSLAMQNDVLQSLNEISISTLNKELSFFESNKQVKTDCY